MQKPIRDGLILRSLNAKPVEDRKGLRDLYRDVFDEEMDDWVAPDDDLWVDMILAGGHPTITDDDIWVVVDPAKQDKVVSSVLLIPQVWHYEDIELGVGRPELVLTHPDYRRRGLVRELFDVCHERSAALGHLMQGITGIAHYYRRFGYTMAVDLDRYATIPLTAVPKLDKDKQPQYTLRTATEADFPQMATWDAYVAPQFTLSTIHPPEFWSYYLQHATSSVQIIINTDGQAVGYVALRRYGKDKWINCDAWVIGDQASVLVTYDDVLRGIKSYTETAFPDDTPLYIGFSAGQLDALTTLIARTMPSYVSQRPYAWYLRVGDMVKFIKTIKPVLEQRLVNSAAHRYTGELKLHFYDLTGLKISFQDGCVTSVDTFELEKPGDEYACDAAFAYDTFLNVVFGYRSVTEIRRILTETWASRKAEVLLAILFPQKSSRLLPM